MKHRNRGLELTFTTVDASNSKAAVDLIIRSLDSRHVKVRRWAFNRALGSNRRSVHQEVIRYLDQMPEQIRERLSHFRGCMTAALRIALLGNDTFLRMNAATMALEFKEYRLIPDLVRFVKNREKVDDTVAWTVLELADRLRADLKKPRRKAEQQELEAIAEECRESAEAILSTFDKHRSRSLLEAYLILAGTDDARVKAAVAKPRTLLGSALLAIFESGSSTGICDLLVDELLSPETPTAVVETLRQRKDLGFVKRLLQALPSDKLEETLIEHPILQALEFLGDDSFPFEELDDLEQSKLIRLLFRSNLPESRRLWLLEYFAINGGPATRAATVEALGTLASDRAAQLIERLLYDPVREVVAAALSQLHFHNIPGGIDLACELRDHADPHIRATARRVLGEADFIAFFNEFPSLSESERQRRGYLALKADPKSIQLLRRELKSLSRDRRLHAVEAVEAMGARERVEDLLMERTKDSDSAIRRKAAELLGEQFAPVSFAKPLRDSADDGEKPSETVLAGSRGKTNPAATS